MKHRDEYEYNTADIITSVKLSDLYSDSGRCIRCQLFRDVDGVIYVFRHWLNQGAGPDHSSDVVESVEELRECLSDEIKYGLLSHQEITRICNECKKYFEE